MIPGFFECQALKAAKDEFYIIASGCSLNFISGNTEKPYIDFMAYEEGAFCNGEWKRGRLNGDNAASRVYNAPMLLGKAFRAQLKIERYKPSNPFSGSIPRRCQRHSCPTGTHTSGTFQGIYSHRDQLLIFLTH